VISFGKILGAAAAVYLAIVLGIAAWRPPFISGPQVGNTFVSPATLGKELLTRYVLPFEILSVLLLVAMVGAVVMAKKKI
jgi:NADH-quinone oxidoreductase subunit J